MYMHTYVCIDMRTLSWDVQFSDPALRAIEELASFTHTNANLEEKSEQWKRGCPSRGHEDAKLYISSRKARQLLKGLPGDCFDLIILQSKCWTVAAQSTNINKINNYTLENAINMVSTWVPSDFRHFATNALQGASWHDKVRACHFTWERNRLTTFEQLITSSKSRTYFRLFVQHAARLVQTINNDLVRSWRYYWIWRLMI